MKKRRKRTIEQIRAYERARYAANIERERARKRAYAKTERRKEQQRRWKKKNPDFSSLWQREQRQKWKIAAMKSLGGLKCNQEGCSVRGDPDVLEIDHIFNDGKHERQKIFGTPFLRQIALKPDVNRYQVLCCNHNRKKHLVNLRAEQQNVKV